MISSIAPMYCLTELLVFTVAQYITFFCWHFPSKGARFFIPTVALFVGACGAVDRLDLFVVAFYDLKYVACTTVADLYIVSAEDFSKGAMIGEALAY